ncbi:MAG TPA: hypothetical protein VIW07_07255 [Candidatus Udaeobacter sp.]
MSLSPDFEFHEDIRLFVYRPRGFLDEVAVARAVNAVGDLEKKLREPFNRFSDTSEIDRVDLNYRYVIHVSMYRVLSYADRPPVKSAILAVDSTIGHYFQLHAIIAKDSPISVRIFQQRDEIAKWLGVPLERLSETSFDQSTQTEGNVP